jgi:prefoldin subunit 5
MDGELAMRQNIERPAPPASYDRSQPAVLIHNLAIPDPTVVAESRRWSTGQRGAAVGAEDLAGIDLTPFVTQALVVGAHAISTAGGVQDTFNLEQLVSDVGIRTSESTEKAATATAAVVTGATEAMQKAANEAKKAIAEAGRDTGKNIADSADAVKKTLLDEVNRLVGGDNPELATRLVPIVDKFSRELENRAAKQTSELFAQATKLFDPHDPASPMSKYTRELRSQQETLRTSLEKSQGDIAAKVDELTTAVRVTASAQEAAAATAKVTPLKGDTYANAIHRLMDSIAVGLGDEYSDTSSVPGTVSRSKKGDGVLSINGGAARVVLEMTDSKRTNWNDYLDEAERNRGAAASLGVVRSADQNNGNTIRCLGSRRIVLSFDPETDDLDLLRTVVQLLRVSAIAASSRSNRDEIHTAEEKIAEAIGILGRIDDIKKVAGTMRHNADKIEQTSEDVKVALARLLGQAQSALSIAESDAVTDAA